jgi:uncharacterized protein
MLKQFASWFIPAAIGTASLVWIGVSLGSAALATAALLIVLEVTLSFDNAVVNAGVLRNMTPMWQQRFLTWGIAIAVFGSRAILPIIIVSVSTLVSPFVIGWYALYEPTHYGELLENAKYVINTFGGMFLAMVAFKYFFNERKERHWIRIVEQHLSKWGSIEAIEVMLAIILLLPISALVAGHQFEVLASGLIGVVLFVLVHQIIDSFAVEHPTGVGSGLALFIYLNLLDAAFSLDSVIGAFALTTNIILITVGLGIGAYFVRSITVFLVHQGTLDNLVYLEHGAHWAILGLAVAMLAGLFIEVPEPITAFVGFVFLSLAYISSRRLNLNKSVQA